MIEKIKKRTREAVKVASKIGIFQEKSLSKDGNLKEGFRVSLCLSFIVFLQGRRAEKSVRLL
jgi:hypothetical protein